MHRLGRVRDRTEQCWIDRSIGRSIQSPQSISGLIGSCCLCAISPGSISRSIQAIPESTEALWIDRLIDPKPPRLIGSNPIDRDPTVGVVFSCRRAFLSAALTRFISDLHQRLHSSLSSSDRQFLKILGGSSKSRGGSKARREVRVRVYCKLLLVFHILSFLLVLRVCKGFSAFGSYRRGVCFIVEGA